MLICRKCGTAIESDYNFYCPECDEVIDASDVIDTTEDEDLIQTAYKWNLLFFEGRMIATNEPRDRKKYNWLIKNEAVIKEKAYSYLKYWKKQSTGTALDYVTDNLRDFMENFNPPTKKIDNSHYNKTPLQY